MKPSSIRPLILFFLVLALPVHARQWTEEMFEKKQTAGTVYFGSRGTDPARSVTVIGSARFYQVQKGDTLLDIARYYSLGFNELSEANPGVDSWLPPAGQVILLPTEWILPDADFEGLVVNVPEMRLYYFHPGKGGAVTVTTYPVGLGRDEWRTPIGKFKITDRTVNPRWVLPESIKKEHIAEGKPAPDFIEGGDPENPLGKYRLRTSLGDYGIHGTDIPWGVGMQVSHGCVRLYPEDIERLYPTVEKGAVGEFVYQPVKIGVRDNRIYIEVHQDIYDMIPALHREAWRLIDKFGLHDRVDAERVKRAVLEQSGVAIEVTREVGQVQEEVFHQAPRGKRPAAGGLEDEETGAN